MDDKKKSNPLPNLANGEYRGFLIAPMIIRKVCINKITKK